MATRPKRPRREQQLVFFDASGAVAGEAKRSRKRTRGVKLGRKARAERLGFVAHRTREGHDWRHPVHVSMRRVKHAPSLRVQSVYVAIVVQLARVKASGVRVVHYSVQDDHLHLIVEGQDRHDLSAQMRKLFSRIALAVNGVAGRRGKLFRDRHHRRDLTGPTEVRNALVYVLFNDRKHSAQNGGPISNRTLEWLDDRSSAAWLDEWAENARPPPEAVSRLRARCIDATNGEAPVSAPRTWLAQSGWFQRGGGRMRLHDMPRFA